MASIAIVIFLPFQAKSTTLVERGFEELIQRSGIIFEGEVLSKYSAYASDKKTIHTFITLSIGEVVKGTIPYRTIELRFVGGTVGDLTVEVPDMPQFEKGDRTILLLKSDFNPTKTFSPVSGFNQGQFLIKSDAIFTAKGMQVLGYNDTKDRLEMVSTKAAPKKNVPVAHDPKKDILVANTTLDKTQTTITKDQFLQMIRTFVKKHGLKGSQFKPLTEEEKFKPIYFKPASAPELKERGAK
jgi:hypothetical protein